MISPEQRKILSDRANRIGAEFYHEALRLANSGAWSPMEDSISILIRVAIENLSERFDKGNIKVYRNLKRF